jgi:TRAP-type mannitol/chloroaromatic compound transport system permease small subunit
VDLEDALLLQRQAARIGELEGWLALMIVQYGESNGSGFTYKLCGEHATDARAKLASVSPMIAIEYDLRRDQHVLDVL